MGYQPQKIKKVLIANRGEIAVRIIQALHELNMQAVAIYTDADKDNLASQLADSAIYIGENLAYKSYLNKEKIIQAALDSGADAIHPGYGFLSESADFAKQVHDAGLIFIGPSSDIIRMMGNKSEAISKAKEAGIPTIQGTKILDNPDEALKEADNIGYPLAIKAVAGGGGKGIRIVEKRDDFLNSFQIAKSEAKAAFGNDGVYCEKYLARAKHIEVQILGDGERIIHLYDRECSLQRRRQKVVEEAPSPSIDNATREELCKSALKLASLVKYSGAGTLEFLYDMDSKQFYFLEMNTRIQVEHAITEMITGVDIVREMLIIADSGRLRFNQSDISMRGASIEIRINAEDPNNNFFPSLGTISNVFYPTGAGIRIDTMLFNGRVIPPFYDSLVAKMIIYDENRDMAISRMNRALRQIKIEGIKTTLPLFVNLFADKQIESGDYDINFLESWLIRNQS